MQAACLGRSDITRRLIGSRVAFQELLRPPSHFSSKGKRVPIPGGAMWRAGLAGRAFDRQHRLNRRHEPVWVKLVPETSSTTTPRLLLQERP